MEEAIEKWGCYEIFDTEKGSHPISDDLTDIVKSPDKKSLWGRGCFFYRVFVEGLRRGVLYEVVCLEVCDINSDQL